MIIEIVILCQYEQCPDTSELHLAVSEAERFWEARIPELDLEFRIGRQPVEVPLYWIRPRAFAEIVDRYRATALQQEATLGFFAQSSFFVGWAAPIPSVDAFWFTKSEDYTLGKTLTHEVGHMLNLSHSDDKHDIMHPHACDGLALTDCAVDLNNQFQPSFLTEVEELIK